MNGKLVLLFTAHKRGPLRTEEVYGTYTIIEVGAPFVMLAQSLTPEVNSVRVVATSPIVEIGAQTKDEIIFKTENSIYKLTIIHN